MMYKSIYVTFKFLHTNGHLLALQICLDQQEATGPTLPFCWQIYQASVSSAFCKRSSLKFFNITRGNLSTCLWRIPPICEDHCGYSLCFVKMTGAGAMTLQTTGKSPIFYFMLPIVGVQQSVFKTLLRTRLRLVYCVSRTPTVY